MPDHTVPDVCVTIIVYNDAERLPRAVRSVLGQSLRNLEVIIADDCSTDGTQRVAEQLAASDSRVRYVRLPENSGGCSAPRNAGIRASRAPYLMFLDSDDELPYHACKSMLLAIEATGADFVTGEVERLYEETGRTGLWYPDLFTERRTFDGLRECPQMLFDHLSTNKIYTREFIDTHALTFPEGMHYEDQLFSARAYCLAKRFAVVPWVMYRWRFVDDPDNQSISNSRHRIENVADRVKAARLVDAFMAESGNADLKPDKDYKFLKHDFRLYLGDLPGRDRAWITEFAEITRPYLDTLAPGAFARLSRTERVCLQLLRRGRLDEAADAARSLARPNVPPRYVISAGGRQFWGQVPPVDDRDRSELDVTELCLEHQPLAAARLRHEVEHAELRGSTLRLRVRTFDPGRVLGTEPVPARVNLAVVPGKPLRVPLRLQPEADGSFTGQATLDLARVPMSRFGFGGLRHASVTVDSDRGQNLAVLLADQAMPMLRAKVSRRGLTHLLTVGVEEAGAGRLEVSWHRRGLLRLIAPVGPVKRRVLRFVGSNRNKATVYRLLTLLPVKKNLAVFEAVEGRQYGDNPRYVYEEVRRQRLPLDVVWSYSRNRPGFPSDARLARRGSWRYVWSMARARYWVDSHNVPSLYGKRRGNRYLQTWHGQTLKTIGFDVPTLRLATSDVQRKHQAMVDRWDVLVSPSAEFERTFVPANNYRGEVLHCGYPRNDALVRSAEPEQVEAARRVRQKLDIPDGRKVLLYAPTYRDFGRGSGSSIRPDLEALAEALAGEWVMVVRAHYYDRFTVPPALGHFLRDGAQFADINELMLASDVLLTDYSSVMFDYANLGRPILLYTDDYEEYRSSDRGTYYDLTEIAPGPMLATTGELVAALRDLDAVQEASAARYAKFREMFCSYETGHASRIVVEHFFGDLTRGAKA
jgi:CDP-glycerol glycerophosphotransferase